MSVLPFPNAQRLEGAVALTAHHTDSEPSERTYSAKKEDPLLAVLVPISASKQCPDDERRSLATEVTSREW